MKIRPGGWPGELKKPCICFRFIKIIRADHRQFQINLHSENRVQQTDWTRIPDINQEAREVMQKSNSEKIVWQGSVESSSKKASTSGVSESSRLRCERRKCCCKPQKICNFWPYQIESKQETCFELQMIELRRWWINWTRPIRELSQTLPRYTIREQNTAAEFTPIFYWFHQPVQWTCAGKYRVTARASSSLDMVCSTHICTKKLIKPSIYSSHPSSTFTPFYSSSFTHHCHI